MLDSIANKTKNFAISKLFQYALGHFLSGAGTVQNVSFDSQNRKVTASIVLKGEPDLFEVTIDNFEISGTEEMHLVIHGIKASKKWLEIMANRFVCGRPIPIKEEYRKVVGYLV